MGISSIDKATANLVKWSDRGEWEALQREVYAAHFEPVIDSLDLPADALDVLPDEGAGMLSVFILEDFFTARFGEHGERNVIDDYLKRRGWRESVPARRYLEALRDSTLSLYEVVDVVPGRHMTVRDLILGGAASQGTTGRGIIAERNRHHLARLRRDKEADAGSVGQFARARREGAGPPGIATGRSRGTCADRAAGSGKGAGGEGGAGAG